MQSRFASTLPDATELHVILRAKWLSAALNWRRGTVISAEGVAPSVGACGTGKEEDGVDYYLTISTRPHSKKKGRRRGGGAARRRVVGEEGTLPVSSSEGLNLESKEEQWKCGFW